MDEIKCELIKTLLNDQFGETIDIVTHVSETLRQTIVEKLKDTIFGENISQIQEIIQASLSDKERFSLSPEDIVKKTTLINTLKEFGHDRQMSEEQILNILRYLEYNKTLRVDESLEEKFNDNTNNRVFCGKKEKIKKFLPGKESYTLTSGEKVSLQPDESKVSINQLIAVMEKIGITDNEKINDLFNYLALEFYSLKFINSYKEFYLENNNIQKIKEYLSKISFILTDENKEEIKAKIKMFNFIRIGSLNNKSALIKRTLLEAIDHNKSNLISEDFCINLEEFELLRGILQDNGIKEPMLYELLLSKSHDRTSSNSNKLFYSNLENILIILYNNDGKISEENLSLRTANEVSKELWCRLREVTVIKEAKVYFKFTNDPEKRIENIQKQVENVVKKVFGLKRKDDIMYTITDWTGFADFTTSQNKELDEYIDSITKILKHAAGLMDYVWMCFNSVLSVKEDKGHWNWDAFACAMIGIAQIVAGITLDICTCGAAHYFAQILIAEGIRDIIFAIQSEVYRKTLNWKAYCQHKVQSLIISLLTAGVGSYLGKGTQVGQMGIGLATKTVILKAIGKETLTQLITGVTSGIVNITTDELNIINDNIHAALLDLQHGDLANAIFNRVTQIAHGISGAYSSTARIFQKGTSKVILFGSIAKMIDKTVSGIKEENKNISILANISEHIKSMEDQMKIAMKEKVKNDFLKPGIQFTLNHAVKPIREFITSPFDNAMDELKDHIDKRADEYMELIEKKGHEALSKLISRKQRPLEQLGCLVDAKHLNPKVLNENVSNLNGQSIGDLIKQYGDNVKIAVKNGKLLAVPPTYKEYMDNIETGIFAGPIQCILAADKYKVAIEVVDPGDNFQPHKDAPNGGTINPTKTKNGKPFKVAYIKSGEKGKVGHIAPVIEVDDELRVVNIKQNAVTQDKCFAQTMLFLEKYHAGEIKSVDIDSEYDCGISKEEINKFYKNLAVLGWQSSSLRQVYQEGITLKNSEFLGGRSAGSNNRDLELSKQRSVRYRRRHPDSEGETESQNPFIAYRSLRPDEKSFFEGLRPPKDHDPNISAKDHIAHGSRAKKKSAYVSASRSIKVAAAWASEGSGLVAEFDVPDQKHLPYEKRSVFDLTDPKIADYLFGSNNTRIKNYAKSSQEITIKDGVGAGNIRKIYEAARVTHEEHYSLKKQKPDGVKLVRTRKQTKDSSLYIKLEETWRMTNNEN
ncbi:unnamed protein product [Rotaria sp. Silwood2]|nr:unnamed protein product [Rotaria sp. Silwood2]